MTNHKLKSVALPYVVFSSADLPTKSRYALARVGRCRIPAATVSDDEVDDITAKCKQQADCSTTNDEKTRKRYMKESVAMASRYINDTWDIDASIVNVEIMIADLQAMIIDTDGCLASCYLDAGAASIVFPIHTCIGDDDVGHKLLEAALDVAKIPRERVILHIAASDDVPESVVCAAIAKFQGDCIAISLATTMARPPSEAIMKAANEANLDIILQLDPAKVTGDETTTPDALGKLSQHHETSTCVAVGLVDPTPEQLGRAYAACIKTDRHDGLFTTVVCTRANEALGLVYSSTLSIVTALECGRGVYYSRSRNSLWRKGDTSGHHQILHRLDLDCDGDAVRFTVTQSCPTGEEPAFCHLQTLTCWGAPHGIRHLEQVMQERLTSAPAGSYTKRLFDDPTLLRDKLVEEAQELAEADTPQHVAEELADVLYFAMARAVKAGVSIDAAVAELDRRSRKVTRRQGDRKDFRIEAGNAILKRTKKEEK